MRIEDQYLPLEGRPRFARKMVALWRLHHMSRGEGLAVLVPAGEWPANGPAELAGARVEHPDWYTFANGVIVAGRVGEGEVRFAMSVMHRALIGMTLDQLALCSAFGAFPVDGGRDGALWLAPHHQTGEVPSFVLPRRQP